MMDTPFTFAQYQETATYIQENSRYKPTIGLILGSGLSALGNEIEDADIIPYGDIPHWPQSTVIGHAGQLIIGKLEGQSVLVLQGRSHYYEGHSIHAVTLPVRIMHLLGIRTIILTNAAGGINANFAPGDLMLIKDHINMPGMAGNNPLRGQNVAEFGPRFPDMTTPYDVDLRALAKNVADEADFQLQEGTYTFVAGPSYETPAELRLLRTIGADAVGMSTVPSVVVARHAGIRVLGISTITNMAIPDPAPGTIINHDEVLETGQIIVPRLTKLVRGILRSL
jgi:purine-nucleoside phosphorylase